MKVLINCSICKKPVWVKVKGKGKTQKLERVDCRRCINLISRLKQKLLNEKRKEKGKESNVITEYNIKREVEEIIKLEKEQSEKLENLRRSKPLSIRKRTIKVKGKSFESTKP